jgi:hypothetical protein
MIDGIGNSNNFLDCFFTNGISDLI